MKNMARHIVTGTLTLLVLWAASCSHDTERRFVRIQLQSFR